jgi:hypothetical protein
MTNIKIKEQYANMIGYTDVSPCEIVKRISDKTIEIRNMDAEKDPSWKADFHPGGFFGHTSNQNSQKWIITSNADNRVFRIRLSKNHGWRDANGQTYQLAETPRRFYDYNF